MANVKAVYPGTFDPVTLGHEDLARRASSLFGHVIVAVAESTAKSTFFTLTERVAMARQVLAKYPNIEVLGFSGLLMEFAREHRARVVIRGLRAVSDFDYEFQMAGMNRNIYPEVETLFLTPSDQFMFISATMVREVARLGGNVAPFVSPEVQMHIAAKLRSLGGP
jgi:pantetheine-phosphate adenylyltransferase